MANNKIKKILILLGLGGIAVSSYLTYIKLTGAIYVCGTGGCATVQTSKYSEMMGIPVAILGLIYYTAFLGLVLIDKRLFVKYWVVFGVLFSTYLTIIEIFVTAPLFELVLGVENGVNSL